MVAKTNKRRPKRASAAAGFAGLVLLLLAGCAHDHDVEKRGNEFSRVYTPQVPGFLNGPAAALLTNQQSFVARTTVQGEGALQQEKPIEGELLCSGTRLLFTTRSAEDVEKDSRATGYIYIWDTATGSGFVLSEALQGYAPVTTTSRITNVVHSASGKDLHEVTVQMNDGSHAVFRVAYDSQKAGVPSRITTVGNPPLSLTLSRVKLQKLPPEVFTVPEGFSKYANPEALADELAVRQHNLRRRGNTAPDFYGSPDTRH